MMRRVTAKFVNYDAWGSQWHEGDRQDVEQLVDKRWPPTRFGTRDEEDEEEAEAFFEAHRMAAIISGGERGWLGAYDATEEST